MRRPQDFASFRKDEIEKELPDPDEEGVGLSMFLETRWQDSQLRDFL